MKPLIPKRMACTVKKDMQRPGGESRPSARDLTEKAGSVALGSLTQSVNKSLKRQVETRWFR